MSHRILVVDAHPLNRLVVAEQLTRLGHAPLCADDADEALALCDAMRFDLVVVACRMPGTDGFALAARLQDAALARGGAPCRIIGYSHDAALDTPLSMQAGMRACLPLPLPVPMLDALLQSLFEPAAAPAVHASRNLAQWDLFVATSREDVHAARRALHAGNLVQLRALFHRIKGAALMIGENDIAAACARGEAGCEEWTRAALEAAIALVEAQLAGAAPQCVPSR